MTAALRRRSVLGVLLMVVGVVVGVTVATTTANGQTILAMGLVAVGGYLWATALWRGER